MFTSIKAKLSHIKVKLHEASFNIITFLNFFWTCLISRAPIVEKKTWSYQDFLNYFKMFTLIVISRGSSNILVS